MLVEKILIANRGEIACRIIRTIKKMGYTSVAVFSDADQNALHVQMADESIYIGPSEPGKSYLFIDNIIQAAKKIQADAIHPGYGFLSENAEFAERCKKEQLIFIGPTAEAIRLMGSKSASKRAMIEAQVPCIPGYQGDDQNDEIFILEAQKMGFPVMVKAAAGGGGRGMRKVDRAQDLIEALKSARSEAQTGFGNPELILEKAIINGRHIEIQVLADTFGHCIHLGERDCSLQRRHQKVIEESPSPLNRSNLREKMGAAAVAAAESCHYVGAGTVEFLVNHNLEFFFLEMNTRIQVEHPVTELVTGIDLIEQQIRIATGEPLQLKQTDIHLKGHAIEARLYAEDPNNHYLPQAGLISRWIAPEGEGIRCDSGINEGHSVSTFYDPMIAKIIGFGSTRAQALRHLSNALRNTTLCGIKTNRDFLLRLLDTDYVREGQFDTSTLSSPEVLNDLLDAENDVEKLTIAAIIKTACKILPTFLEHPSLIPPQKQIFTLDDSHYDVHLKFKKSHLNCLLCDVKITTHTEKDAPELIAEHSVQVWSVAHRKAEITFDHVRTHYHYQIEGNQIWISNRQFSGVVDNFENNISSEDNSDGKLYAPMDGRILYVCTSIGTDVQKDQILAVLDAMKIEHPIKAPFDGVVQAIFASENQQVKNKQLIISLAKRDAQLNE